MRALTKLSAAACAAAGLALATPAPAYADSPVVLEGADDPTRDAIARLLPDRDAPETLFDAERIAEEAAARALAWLRAEGYYQGQAESVAEDNPPRARVRLTLGPRFHLGPSSVAYDGEAPVATARGAVAEAIKTAPMGAPARAQAVLGAEASAVAALQRDGYPEAEAGERRVVVDHADQSMAPSYRFAAGDRARLGVLVTDPAGLFRPGFLSRVTNWREGEDFFAPERLSQLRRDISATGAVSRVATRLEPAAPGSDVRNVVLEVEPAPRNAYEFGAGYSTTEGVGVEAAWSRRNYTRRGDTLRMELQLSELVQDLTAEITRPHAAGIGRTIRLTGAIQREDTEPYTREGVSIAAAVESAERLRLGLSYGVSISADRYTDTAGVSDAVVLSGFGELRRDTTGNPLDARDGDILVARLEPSVSAGDASIGFVRAIAEARTYETRGQDSNLTLAARVRGGWLTVVSGSDEDVPPDRRFYAGGGGSVRGYEYNSIYPEERIVRANTVTPGGQGVLETSLEARYRFGDDFFDGNLGAVAFIDGGSAFDEWGDATDFRWGAGIGARYNLGFAPLRVDLAFPLDKRPGDADYALYVSLGQAF